MDTRLKAFAARLQEAAKRRGIPNARQLSLALKIDASGPSGWWKGTRAPELDYLGKLVELLGVDGTWLLTGEGDPHPLPPIPAQQVVRAVQVVFEVAGANPASLGRVLTTLAAIRRESEPGAGSPPPPE